MQSYAGRKKIKNNETIESRIEFFSAIFVMNE